MVKIRTEIWGPLHDNLSAFQAFDREIISANVNQRIFAFPRQCHPAYNNRATSTVIRQAMSRLQKCLPERASDTLYRSLNAIVT